MGLLRRGYHHDWCVLLRIIPLVLRASDRRPRARLEPHAEQVALLLLVPTFCTYNASRDYTPAMRLLRVGITYDGCCDSGDK